MDGTNVINAISTVGFPIVMCLILVYVVYKMNEQHKEEMNKMNEALNNNTLAIQHLSDLLGKGDTTNDKKVQ